MIRFGPVFRILAIPTLARLALLLALVVAVFMAESFTSLLEEALRNDAESSDVLWLLTLEAPEIMDLALALGVLIAVYFAVLDSRNRGELVILSVAGVRWTKVVSFALLFGLVGGVLSICIAGYLVPQARYIERISMTKLKADFILRQITTPEGHSSRLTILDTTFIATSPTSDKQERGQLFVFQPGIADTWRVSQSHDWTVVGPDLNGSHNIRLESLRAYDGSFGADPPRAVSAFGVNSGEMAFRLSDVVHDPDYSIQEDERLLNFSPEEMKHAASVGARALLVPMAALLALVAVLAGGAGFARFLTLPLASIILLFCDVAGRSLIAEASLSLSPWVLSVLAVFAYLGPPLGYVLWRGEAIMKPVKAST
ncbi:Lipopolysaccharide export LptBFGC system, permease protein LptF [Shimia gijangensis]|uniref:Lipopolysaccharide export LptBFGC system, permease protein LptF n=1 Tax=Shimia gijangensis TaxID=1470563 RepID=A0A1M6JSZ8_9RHOB|nr:LptF/LptG family permease [Shimia gijangensis]SHJ49776.1 Lipopolysaccharide export LptBFGC system, permease protein LptF [Shimia gijangensis]